MRSRNSHFKATRLPAVLLVCAVLVTFGTLAFFNCSDSGPSGSLTPEQMAEAMEEAAVAQEQYVQALAEKFAPYLWFDWCVPWVEKRYSFPMDAAEYYHKREYENVDYGIHQFSYTKVMNGEIPTYYDYHACAGDLTVQPRAAGMADNCVPLLAGKTTEVGTVCLESIETDSGTYLGAIYNLTDGWELTEVHFWLGDSLSDIPQTRKGNPKVGHFPYKADGLNGATSCSLYVPPVICGETIYGAAHAEVRKSTGDDGYMSESAWAAGDRMVEKGNWATYFSAEQTCAEEITYWWFYGYQPICWATQGSHHGDWERVAVKIIDGELKRAMFFQHAGWYTKEPQEGFEVNDGSCGHWEGCNGGKTGEHPVVFVGLTGHGSYPDRVGQGPKIGAGVPWWGSMCCYFRDWRDPFGIGSSGYHEHEPVYHHMHCDLNLVRLVYDGSGPEWMTYKKGWSLDNWGTSKEGPFGPIARQGHPEGRPCNMYICEGWDDICNNSSSDQQGCMRNRGYEPRIF